jgi:hypothetical protein
MADPSTMRIGDPRFEQLVTTEAWRTLDRSVMSEGSEALRFFPAFKQLTIVLARRNAFDEMLVLGLYGNDVYGVFVVAGDDMVAHLPADDPTLPNRRGGIEKIRLGAAIDVCGMLYVALDATAERRRAALAALARPDTYGFHSRQGLQLITATLDDRLLPNIRAELRPEYQAIRDVVATLHDARPADGAGVTYQGMGPPGLDVTKLGRVVSTTGGFSVDAGPAALAKRVELQQGGSVMYQHWIEAMDGPIKLEAACLDTVDPANLVAVLQGSGAAVEPSSLPGTWLGATQNGTRTRIRVLAIHGRACVASVEAPTDQFPDARAEAFLTSLAPAP